MSVVKCSRCGVNNDAAFPSGCCGWCGQQFSDSPPADSEPRYPELGYLRKTYRVGSRDHWGNLTAAIILCLLLLGIAVGLGLIAPAPQDAAEWLGIGVACLIIAVLYTGLMYAAILPAVAAFKERVLLYEGGIVIDPTGTPQVFKWNEIESIRLKITEVSYGHLNVAVHGGVVGALVVGAVTAAMRAKGAPTEFTIRTREGRTGKVTTGIKDSGELAEEVQDEIAAILFPQALEMLRQGRKVAFDGLSVSEKGLHKESGGALPWPEVKEVTVDGGQLVVRSQKGWFAWYADKLENVPNPRVLQVLVDQYTKVGRGGWK